jgi:steroid 5-alpha reductase family enzyme
MLTYLAITLAVALGINVAMFVVAYRQGTDRLTDISYAVTFITVAAYGLFTRPVTPLRFLLFAMVTIWAVRLGAFLLSRVVRKGKDARFDNIRGNFRKFATFWVGQGLAAWVVLIPALLALHTDAADISLIAWLGVAVWAAGTIIEAAADSQKRRFSLNPANQGRFISSGIWAYSRHPNYFGEILLWTGIYITAATVLEPVQALAGLVSPIYIAALLLYVSGIPILEKNADAKWGKESAYQDYKRRTSLLIPLPPKQR